MPGSMGARRAGESCLTVGVRVDWKSEFERVFAILPPCSAYVNNFFALLRYDLPVNPAPRFSRPLRGRILKTTARGSIFPVRSFWQVVTPSLRNAGKFAGCGMQCYNPTSNLRSVGNPAWNAALPLHVVSKGIPNIMRSLAMYVFLLSPCFLSVAVSAEFESPSITVTKEGSGPDVILVHGFASSSDVWDDVAKRLAEVHTVRRVQIAGFAGTAVPVPIPENSLDTIRDEILRYIKTEDLEAPVLVGHSMGGLLALRIAAKHSSSVGSLVIVDSLPFFPLLYNPNATVEMVTPQAKMLETAMLAQDDEQFEARAKQSLNVLTKDETQRDQALKWSTESDRKLYAQLFRELMTTDARPELDRVKCPVTVIFAFDEDAGVTQEHVQAIYSKAYEGLEGLELKGVDDSYHFIMWDQLDSLMELLDDALSDSDRKN